MSETADPVPPTPRAPPLAGAKRSFKRRAIAFAVAFAISLVVGRFFETVASERAVNTALGVQKQWMATLSDFSPWGVAGIFNDKMGEQMYASSRHMELNAEGRLEYVSASGTFADGLTLPLKSLGLTVVALATSGGILGLAQLGLGALAVALILAMIKKRTRQEAPAPLIIFGWPFAVILAASLIALPLKLLMVGALGALSWITNLAAGAAGATGFVGFCWYCLQKLGEKGAEHALTPKI